MFGFRKKAPPTPEDEMSLPELLDELGKYKGVSLRRFEWSPEWRCVCEVNGFEVTSKAKCPTSAARDCLARVRLFNSALAA